MQLFNVYQGGTLIYDIPSVTQIGGHAKVQGTRFFTCSRTSSFLCVGIDQRHEILVDEKTLLNEITGCVRGAVNSSHHQCVETLGANLSVAARAEDPIIEAIQWKNAKENPFYLGVQVERIIAIVTFFCSCSISVASRANGRSDESLFVQHSTSLSRRCRPTQENSIDRYRGRRRRRTQRLREQQRKRKRTARQQADQVDHLNRR